MMIGIPNVWPVIYVANKTNEYIKNSYFTLDDYIKTDSRIKKIKRNETSTTSICNREYSGNKTLYLYHYGKDSEKHQYIIYDKLNANYLNNIKVIIKKVEADGSFAIDAIIDYDPLKTH